MKHAVLTPGLQDCDEATRFVARRESQERQYFWLVPTPQPPVEEKEMWLASPLLERRLTEPVRHLCDGARGCGCVVVSNDSGSARSVMSRTTLQDRTVKGHVGSTLTKPGAEA